MTQAPRCGQLRHSSCVALVLLVAFVGLGASAQPNGSALTSWATKRQQRLKPADLYAKRSRSVVLVKVPDGSGSGVVVGDELVVTSKHVVDGAEFVQLHQGDASWEARVLWSDEDADLALLRAPGMKRPAVPMRPAGQVRVGEPVYAIGCPRGFELTLTDGLISAVRVEDGLKLLQNSAAISPGSSGGALFDETGQLVGITTFFWKDSQNLNFAVASDHVAHLMATLERMLRGLKAELGKRSAAARLCPDGTADGCFRKASAMYLGEERAKDLPRARELFRRACDAGSAGGCSFAGTMMLLGEGGPQDEPTGAALVRLACNRKEAASCSLLGRLLVEGWGVEKAPAEGARLLERGCDSDVAEDCLHLGKLYWQGTGVPKNRTLSAFLFGRACDAEELEGCVRLGLAYDTASGVEENAARALALYARGCDGSVASGCWLLGTLYEEGRGAAADAQRAAQLYRRACTAGTAKACTALARLYSRGHGVSLDVAVAGELFKKACDGGDREACGEVRAVVSDDEEGQH